MPRRLTPPNPALDDGVIRLAPMTQADHADLLALTADGAVKDFTYVPTDADAGFVRGWIERYELGWKDGSRAGFVARDAAGDRFLGFASVVQLDLELHQGEIGYAIAPPARGRGVAGRAVSLLTNWGFSELDLIRLELRIDVKNRASERVAERAGYRREGVLRSLAFKEGRRSDVAIWSRLRDDGPVP